MKNDNGKKAIAIKDNNGDNKITPEDLIPYLGDSSYEKMFKDPESTNAMRLMMLSDPEFINNVFRYNIPDYQFAVAMAAQIRACIEHGFDEGVNQAMIQLGLMASVKGERINQFVTAVCGNRDFQERKIGGGGLMDKIKNMYGDK